MPTGSHPDLMPVFIYTRHAEDTLADRGITRDEVEQTVLKPEERAIDPRHPERLRAFRNLPDRGGRFLRVVYVEEATLTYRIITFFLDRGRRRSRESQIRSRR